MKKNGNNKDNSYSTTSGNGGGTSLSNSERSSYHNPSSQTSSSDKKCDNCRYRVTINECTTFKCKDCGSYIVSCKIKRFEWSRFKFKILYRYVTTVIKSIWKRVDHTPRKRLMKISKIYSQQ